ncbi:MAG: hypothetical protein ACKOCQ_02265 [Candidatus Nitrosotenuis sp.]
MNKFAKFAAFSILGLALLITPHASHAYYAATSTTNKFTTTVTASKKSYGSGESIELSGQATPYEEGRKLSLIVRDGASNIMVLKTVPVNPDGTYTYSITDTTTWKKGTYNVAAQYGSSDVNIGTTILSFDPAVKAEPVPAATPEPAPTPEKKADEKPKAEPKKVKEVKKPVKKTKPKKN